MDEKGIKEEHEQSNFERVGEKVLWSTRYVVLIAVISSVIASIVLFVVGSYEIVETIIREGSNLLSHKEYHEELLVGIIAGVDFLGPFMSRDDITSSWNIFSVPYKL